MSWWWRWWPPSAIKKAHCAVGKVTRTHSKKVKSGKVTASKPGAGSIHKRGTKINLTISAANSPRVRRLG